MLFKKKTDAIVIVLNELFRILGYKITERSIEERILQHSSYPSLFSITNTITNLGISNKAVRITNEQIDQLETPFLATTILGETILVTSLNNKNVECFSQNQNKIIDIQEFFSFWNNLVILVDTQADVTEINYDRKRKKEKLSQLRLPLTIGFVVCSVIVMAYYLGNSYLLWFTILKLVGLSIAILLINKEVNKTTEYSFCKVGKKVDCNEVLNSPAANIFSWLSMTDVGFLYFAGTFLALVICGFGQNYIVNTLLIGNITLSFLSIPYTIFSLGYQAFKVKKWCALCIGIITILWVEALLGYCYFKFADYELLFNVQGLWTFFLALLFPTIIWIYLKSVLKKSVLYKGLLNSYFRITSDLNIFKILQSKEKEVKMDLQPNEVIIGNLKASNTILVALNPFCPACGREYNHILTLLEKHPDFAKIIIRFVGNPFRKEEAKLFASSMLIAIYKDKTYNFNEVLKNWFATKDYDSFMKNHPLEITTEVMNSLKHHYMWSQKVGIDTTPAAFFNNRKFSEHYSIKQLNRILEMAQP